MTGRYFLIYNVCILIIYLNGRQFSPSNLQPDQHTFGNHFQYTVQNSLHVGFPNYALSVTQNRN